jgi:hypothetical protein
LTCSIKKHGFVATSGVQFPETNQDDRVYYKEIKQTQFHFRRSRRSAPKSKSKVGHILTKVDTRINLNIDRETIAPRSHTHPSHSQNLSPLILVPHTDTPIYVFPLLLAASVIINK